MKRRDIKISLGTITSRIFDACKKRCTFDCCGLHALDIQPVWMVGVLEDNHETELSENIKLMIEQELETTLGDVAEHDGSEVIFEISKHYIRCNGEELKLTFSEIKNALKILLEKGSFDRLVAGKYYSGNVGS